MRSSIFARLIIASVILLGLFFGVVGYMSEGVFKANLIETKKKRLAIENATLVAEANVEDDAITMPEEMSEALFDEYESGLYALVINQQQQLLWRSYSAHSISFESIPLNPDDWVIGKSLFKESADYYIQQRVVSWEVSGDQPELIMFLVLESKAESLEEIATFRRQIRDWLIAITFLLVASMVAILWWGIRPIRVLGDQLTAIEKGRAKSLKGNYPIELKRFAKNLNGLLETERKQRERYQTTLADLAHSLKTPLAVMQAELEVHGGEQISQSLLKEQAARIDDIIKHQLQRAVVATPNRLSELIDVDVCVNKLFSAFEKIYIDKAIQFSVDIVNDLSLRGDKRDLMEVLGNLLDNACKACEQQVLVKAYQRENITYIEVHDDGAGIPLDYRDQVLKRGLRADSVNVGQGIGLDVVRDIVASYGGDISIGKSSLGGALFRLSIIVSDD